MCIRIFIAAANGACVLFRFICPFSHFDSHFKWGSVLALMSQHDWQDRNPQHFCVLLTSTYVYSDMLIGRDIPFLYRDWLDPVRLDFMAEAGATSPPLMTLGHIVFYMYSYLGAVLMTARSLYNCVICNIYEYVTKRVHTV